jgi:RNA polymerase sigma-70 factor (sigma-E family)
MNGMQRADRTAERDAEFSEFYAARARPLRRVAYVVTRDWHAAEDVTQRAFVKIYRAWPRIERAGLEAYARRAVVNESLSYVTRRPRDVVVETVPDQPVPETVEVLDLSAALSTLPAQQRAVIALRFVDDRSVAETAEALGIAEGTVKSHTAKAIATLRRHVPTLAPDHSS